MNDDDRELVNTILVIVFTISIFLGIFYPQLIFLGLLCFIVRVATWFDAQEEEEWVKWVWEQE